MCLRCCWRLLRCALMASCEPLFGMRHNDAGVGKLESRINASEGSKIIIFAAIFIDGGNYG